MDLKSLKGFLMPNWGKFIATIILWLMIIPVFFFNPAGSTATGNTYVTLPLTIIMAGEERVVNALFTGTIIPNLIFSYLIICFAFRFYDRRKPKEEEI